MKIKKSTLIILIAVGAMFLVGVIIVALSYNSIRKQLLNENQEYLTEKANSLSLLLRYYIISGNLPSAHNYIDEIAATTSISYFGIVTENEESNGDSMNGRYNIEGPGGNIISELQSRSVFRDVGRQILYAKAIVYFDEKKSVPAAVIYFGFDYGNLAHQMENLSINFFVFIMIMSGCFLAAIVTAVKLNHQNYGLLLNYFFNISQHNDSTIPKGLLEYEGVILKAQEMAKQLHRMKSMEKDAAIGVIAAQVAHDIRSPLAALNAATQDISQLPEDRRIMIRSAVQRIGDIANDLAGRGAKKTGENDLPQQQEKQVQLLSGVLDSLISEKRLQYRSKLNVNIESNLGSEAYGLFAAVQPAQFKRVMSNLINNAVEALAANGTVTVSMERGKKGDIEITVKDTGAGIPADVLPKLMQRGASFGKKEGQGLGLFHAREIVESWGGAIKITSEIGKGTMVTINLPFHNEPNWFVPELIVYPQSDVVIFDDDDSIHQIWKGRLEHLAGSVSLHHFSQGEALRLWSKERTVSKPLLVLCDYEILGASETGLDVIKSLSLSEHTILVTSRFEETDVRDNCEKLGIRLLPKNLAGFVPIKFVEIPNDLEFVLIDDSRMNRSTWEIMARAKKRKVITFERPKDFYAVAATISKDAKLYVDLNLADGVSGIDITREISTKGFENIFLYTGEDHVDTTSMPWIKGVVGKSVPFGR